MKDTALKHLTLKTAFLLALASSKRRSEIHAWVANKVFNLGQWEKVTLFPSDFIAKNQLAREGSQSVAPVTIPALSTIVDRQFKEDRTLRSVQALRYYLGRTKDLRGSGSPLSSPSRKDIPQKGKDIPQIDPLLSLLGWNIPFYLVINKQTNKPWTRSKLHRMIFGPWRPFSVGYWWTISCTPVTGKLTHIYKYLLKGPYLVGQKQYVSGTSSGGTSPRSFPSDRYPRKEKKGGTSATTKFSGV